MSFKATCSVNMGLLTRTGRELLAKGHSNILPNSAMAPKSNGREVVVVG